MRKCTPKGLQTNKYQLESKSNDEIEHKSIVRLWLELDKALVRAPLKGLHGQYQASKRQATKNDEGVQHLDKVKWEHMTHMS